MRRCLAPPARVLVRMPSWLGDFVMAEPVVRALHARWSSAGFARHITLAGPARFLSLLAPLGRDGVRFVPAERGITPDPRTWHGHDVALLLDGSVRSAWAACAARIPERVGFAGGGRSALLTGWIAPAKERGRTPLGIGRHGHWPRRLPRPFASACVELAAACGLEVTQRTPRLIVDERAHASVHERLARARILRADDHRADSALVLIHAGSRPGSSKAVPPAQWAAIIAGLDPATRIVVTCARGEESPARALRELVPRAVVLDDPPLDVVELAAAHAFADVVLTGDAGPRHLAQACTDAPVVVLCGPTDPRHTSDHRSNVRVVRVETECGPCHRETCSLSGDDQHACLRRIDPGVVTIPLHARQPVASRACPT